MKKWVADFETTSARRKEYDGQTFVWGVGVCEIGNPSNAFTQTTLEDFLEWCENQKSNDMVYFHNIRFDGNFIIQYLLTHGYAFASTPQEKKSRTFTAFINDKGLWYEIEIFFKVKGSKVNKVTLRDSLKLIPLSVREIAKAFRLEIRKGEIDYTAHDFLPYGSPLTEKEEDYILRDIRIVEHALNFFFENGHDKITIGSCAMADFKKIIGERRFDMYFPKPFYDADVRKAFKGGFTFLNPKFEGKTVDNVLVFDKNSLYSSVMAGCEGEILPYGTPIFYRGEYEPDEKYPLYVQKIRCAFELKKNKIPTIQIKGDYYYGGGTYLKSSDDEELTLYLTSVDLALFKEQYDHGPITYLSGWKFQAAPAESIFGEYVYKWSNIKIESKERGNWSMYLIAKLFLNNLFGKFGTATEVTCKKPTLQEDGTVRFPKGDTEKKKGIYIGMACFITAYARAITVRAAQKIQDDYYAGKSKIQFIYCDTDSLHVHSPCGEIPESLHIHPTELGAWDHEATARKGKFLRQKCYIEEHIITEERYLEAMADDDTIKELYYKEDNVYYFMKITVAGMPATCHTYVTFDNFKIGAKYAGKLTHKTVAGGVVLQDIDFTIKR